MNGISHRFREKWPAFALLLAGLSAHGILVFTDYVLWDGFWYFPELWSGSGAAGMRRLFDEVGRPMDYWFLMPFVFWKGVAAPKVLSVLVWILIPIPTMFVLRRGAGLPRNLAFASALLAGALPVFDVLGEISVWMNTAALLLFWCGLAVLVHMAEQTGNRRILLRLVAICLLVPSFNLNSLLPFFYAVTGFILISRAFLSRTWKTPGAVARFVFRHTDFAFLPIAFWVVKTTCTPVHGYYVGHNQPVLSLQHAASGVEALWTFLRGEGSELFASGIGMSLALLAALVCGFSAWGQPRSCKAPGTALRSSLVALAGGGGLLLAAAFPYMAVGQPLGSFGWISRNCILTPLPIAMMVCGLFMCLNRVLLRDHPHAWTVPVAALCVLSVSVCNRNYMQWQALGAKQESIGFKMRSAIETSGSVVVQLRDYFIIPDTIYYYAPVVWTYIASGSKSRPETFVFDTAQSIPHEERADESGDKHIVFPQVVLNESILRQMIEETTMPYMLDRIPTTGPQIMFVATQGKSGSDAVSIGLRYLWLKWMNPQKLPDFLDHLTQTQVLQLPPVTGLARSH